MRHWPINKRVYYQKFRLIVLIEWGNISIASHIWCSNNKKISLTISLLFILISNFCQKLGPNLSMSRERYKRVLDEKGQDRPGPGPSQWMISQQKWVFGHSSIFSRRYWNLHLLCHDDLMSCKDRRWTFFESGLPIITSALLFLAAAAAEWHANGSHGSIKLEILITLISSCSKHFPLFFFYLPGHICLTKQKPSAWALLPLEADRIER